MARSKPLGLNIIEFFEHPACLNLRGILSPAQRITLKAIYGIPLDTKTPIPIQHEFQDMGFANEVDMFLWLTGKDEYIPGQRYSDISLCVGRRSGKSTLIGAGIALYQSTQFDYIPYLGTSPNATIPIVSPTKEQAGEVYEAIKLMILRSPYIFNEFMDGDLNGFQTEYDETDIGRDAKIIGRVIQLNNKVVIKVLTADISNIRGFAAPFWIMDEACFMGGDVGESKNTDIGIFEALDPTTAQFEDIAFGLKISSPNGESGLMHGDYEKRKDPDVLHIQSPTWYYNPSITAKYLRKKMKKGMSYFNREYGAQYTSSESSYLDPKLIDNCIIRGMTELDYVGKYRYVAAIDYATKHDYWALAIGHKEYVYDPEEKTKKEYIYIDCYKHWKGRQGAELDPAVIVPEICVYLKRFRAGMCLSDQYAFAALRALFQREGCTLKEHAASSSSKIKTMFSLQVAINSGALRVVHEPLAIKHMKDLREKRTKSGTIRIEHANGCNDDYADVTALCVYQFDKSSPVYIGLSQEDEDDTPITKDARGQYVAMPTANDLAEYTGISHKFHDNRAEKKLEEEGGEDEEGDFWFLF